MRNDPPTIPELVNAALSGVERIVTYNGELAERVVDTLQLDKGTKILTINRSAVLHAPLNFVVIQLEV